jgi:hypothetical protein
MNPNTAITTATDVRDHLRALYAERALAEADGLTAIPDYLADLEAEIAVAKNVYVAAAVTEIATLRAELSGRLQG